LSGETRYMNSVSKILDGYLSDLFRLKALAFALPSDRQELFFALVTTKGVALEDGNLNYSLTAVFTGLDTSLVSEFFSLKSTWAGLVTRHLCNPLPCQLTFDLSRSISLGNANGSEIP
jgi:hypothetical protein